MNKKEEKLIGKYALYKLDTYIIRKITKKYVYLTPANGDKQGYFTADKSDVRPFEYVTTRRFIKLKTK